MKGGFMPTLDFYGWSQISSAAYNMYVPFIKISDWDDRNTFPGSAPLSQAIWNILSTTPAPTYFISNLLQNINNGLNVSGAVNQLGLTDSDGQILSERCEKNYDLTSPNSMYPYITLYTDNNPANGLWYGGLNGTNNGNYPYYLCLVETPGKTCLLDIHDFTVNAFKNIGDVFKSYDAGAWEYWCGCLTVWDKSDFERDYPDVVIPNPPRQERDKDPYSDGTQTGGPSIPGGGPGTSGLNNWDPNSDSNPVPTLPSLSAADTGFITLFNPTMAELKALASYMWSGLFDINAYRKIMADPMDTIIGLSIVPVNVPSGAQYPVTVGNISTGISMTKATSQYVEVNCGTVTLSEYWKAYLDYSPYTKVSIYLPYIGSQELDIDLIQNQTVGVVYHIDILSGGCVAYVSSGGNVIAQFSGECAVSIPITAKDLTQTIMNLCQLVASGVGVVASGGMSAPVTAASVGEAATAMSNTANNVVASKPTFPKSGNISGANGLLAGQIPYLLIERPKQCSPARQNNYTGYPAYITKILSSLRGFTQVQDIHIENINCTEEEREEILRLLREGVML